MPHPALRSPSPLCSQTARLTTVLTGMLAILLTVGMAVGMAAAPATATTGTPPVVSITNLVGPPLYNRLTDDITFTVTDDTAPTRVECAMDSAAYDSCSSPWRFARLSDGPHQVRIRATDLDGNETVQTKDFLVDSTPPKIGVGHHPQWITTETDAAFTWSFSDALSGVREWECFLSGGGRLPEGGCTETGVTLTNLPEGSHTLMLSVRDRAGNGNVNNRYFDWIVDTHAPEVDITQAPASTTQDRTATVTWSVDEAYQTTCQLDDQPAEYCQSRSVTYSDLSLGEHRLLIRVEDRAGNVAERAVTWTVVKVPDAPGDVVAVPGDQEALVHWTPPAEYGLPVTGYVITASPGGRMVTVPADRAVASVSGLDNGTAYTFTVAATTRLFGGSAPSAPSTEVVPAGWPHQPREVTAQRRDASALVSWTPANGNGAPITEYTVTVAPGDRIIRVPGDQTSVVVEELDGVGPYAFRVTATTWVGESAASYPASVIFAEVPGAPTGVKAVRGNHSATVSWTPPADDGGIAVSDYTITVRPGGQTFTVGTERTEWSVFGLTNGTAYTLTVVATNPAGSSAASAPSNRVVPAGIPGRVARPDVSRKGARSAVVRWRPPSDNHSPIKRYRVIPSTGKAKVVSSDVRRVRFPSLRKGRHEFTVVAVNDVGSSRPSLPGRVRLGL